MMYTNVVTAPAAEPITLTAAKLALRLDTTADDTLVTELIAAARQHAENISRQVLITTTYETWLDKWPEHGVIVLPKRPVKSITSITYYTLENVLTTVDASTYITSLSAARPLITPAYSCAWPTDLRSIDPIRILYVAGQGADSTAVDARYRNLITALVQVWYESRDTMTAEHRTKLAFVEQALRQDGW